MLAAQNAGGGTSSQVLVKVECLHTIAEIIEKFPAAELFKFSKQLLQVLKSLLDDKKRVIKALFIFLEYLIDDDQPEKEVKIILDYIHKQPGLMSNIILNLN